MLGKLLEIDLGGTVADRDVDLALGEDKVGNLVVATAGQAQLLEVVAGEDVVDVAAVEQEIAHGDVARKEAPFAELHLGGLIDQEEGAGAAIGSLNQDRDRCRIEAHFGRRV
ncbi:MAG: hypothetical protein KA118_15420 [Verrucomicrobia bacterium]|nr:hypothetical protein [Verrucomicrobiota bacterium]